jgi:peptidoglycan/LPS O-acetylase OafA/YrhL
MQLRQDVAPVAQDMAAVQQLAGRMRFGHRPAALSGVPSSYVPEVDALRCLAMSAVIAIHCGLFPVGWMGVWLFFVVSGFAVTTALFSAKHNVRSIWNRIGTFYARRALRIWPIYFGYIAIGVIVIVAIGKPGELQELPWLLTFTENIKMIIMTFAPNTFWPGFGHLWSLSVEQQFYLVFPCLLFLPSRRSRSLVLLAVIVIAPFIRYATALWAASHGYDDLRTAYAVYAFGPSQFDAFAIGTLIAMYRDEIVRDKRLARWAAILAAAVTVVYVMAYMIVNFTLIGHLSVGIMRNIVSGIIYGQGREIWAYFVPTLLGAAALMGILAGERRCLTICRLPGLQAIGRVSYGGYLYHLPVLMILGSTVPLFARPVTGLVSYAVHILLFICAYAITVALAWLSLIFVEERFTRPQRARTR